MFATPGYSTPFRTWSLSSLRQRRLYQPWTLRGYASVLNTICNSERYQQRLGSVVRFIFVIVDGLSSASTRRGVHFERALPHGGEPAGRRYSLAVPQLGSRASSGRDWQLWAARYSRKRPVH
eukprot:scaffold117994_cov72-Phaeocystis_antarctica.AAC.1